MLQDALIVFAKVPKAGHVKTRLTSALSSEQAARVYEAFVRDSLAQYVRLGVAVRLYLVPSTESLPPGLVADGITIHEQRGAGLGSRMQHAFIDTFGAGYGRAVIVGTDHPSLPPEFIQIAFDSLADLLSVCIGPSEDGGYYLLGMNDLFPGLFTGMEYSHPGVFQDTLDRIEQSRANVTILPPWYDVDTVNDLRRLVSDLEDASIEAPHTRAVLGEIIHALER